MLSLETHQDCRAPARTAIVAAALLACANLSTSARGQDGGSSVQASKFGLEGVDGNVRYIFETMRVVDGGVEETTSYLGNLDLILTADLHELAGWENWTALLYGLGTHGDNPSRAAGDFQTISNIEAPEAFRLYEAWIQRSSRDGTISGRFGLYDVNSEFDVIDSATLFVQSSHGIGAEFGTSGRNGPSIFPVTSLAARLDVAPNESSRFRAVVADGVPGDPNHPRATTIELGGDDGMLLAAEFETTHSPANDRTDAPSDADARTRFAAGTWMYTEPFDERFRTDTNGNPERSTSAGAYAFAEHDFAPETCRGLSAFLRLGLANGRVQAVDRYVGCGIVQRGLFQARPNDRAGLAVAAARFSSDDRAARGGSSATDEWEIAFELTYRAEITPWFSVQPDVQYVRNPSGNRSTTDALVLGIRGELVF